jgi:hypothetical protein
MCCPCACACLQKGEAVAAAAAEQSQRKTAAEGAKERRGVLFYKVTVKVGGFQCAPNVAQHAQTIGHPSTICPLCAHMMLGTWFAVAQKKRVGAGGGGGGGALLQGHRQGGRVA